MSYIHYKKMKKKYQKILIILLVFCVLILNKSLGSTSQSFEIALDAFDTYAGPTSSTNFNMKSISGLPDTIPGSTQQSQSTNFADATGLLPIDQDGDGLISANDNCPGASNPQQLNFDNDSFGDDCDADIDGDGMLNTFEDQYALNNFDPSDALLDIDFDKRTNLEEANGSTNPLFSEPMLPLATYDTTRFLEHVRLADINQDGKLDMVTVSRDTSEPVVVKLANAAGEWLTKSNVLNITGNSVDVAIIDIDDDTHLDLAVLKESGSVQFLRGDSSGNFNLFSASTNNPFLVDSESVDTQPRAIVATELNGDNIADFVTANEFADSISILISNGLGDWDRADVSVGTRPYGLAVDDVDGVNGLDIVVANSFSNSVDVLLNNGLNSFSIANSYSVGTFPTEVSLVDINGDFNLDILTPNPNSDNISILFGDGNGGFPTSSTLTVDRPIAGSSAMAGPNSLIVTDIDADTHDDLVVAMPASGEIGILFGDSMGNFATSNFYFAGSMPSTLATGLIDADNRIDIAVTTNTNGVPSYVTTLLNLGLGDFSSIDFISGITGIGPHSIKLADVTGSDELDAIVAINSSNRVSIMDGDGMGNFTETQSYTVGLRPVQVQLANLDANAGLDIVVTNQFGDSISVLLDDGLGSFNTPVSYPVGIDPTQARIVDVNKDSNLDIVTVNLTTSNISVLLGDGLGGFSTATNFAVGSLPRALVASDFNGDTNVDVVTGNLNNSISVLLGDGTGNFGTPTNFTVSGNAPWGIEAAEVTGDQHKDLLIIYNSNHRLAIVPGDGNGNFGTQTNYTIGTLPRELQLSDIDQDGNLDAVTTSNSAGLITINFGDGQGDFSLQRNYVAGVTNYGFDRIDINNDNVADFVFANFLNPSSISTTFGQGPFTEDRDRDGLSNEDEVLIFNTNPDNNDSDSDGLSDGDEVNLYGSNPNTTDTDGDGLSDGDEVNIYSTDPILSDSDGDGFSDGDEVNEGSDPNDSMSTPLPTSVNVPNPYWSLLFLAILLLLLGFKRDFNNL